MKFLFSFLVDSPNTKQIIAFAQFQKRIERINVYQSYSFWFGKTDKDLSRSN